MDDYTDDDGQAGRPQAFINKCFRTTVNIHWPDRIGYEQL